MYAVQTHPQGNAHVVAASEVRGCSLWNWRQGSWALAKALAAVTLYADVRVSEERRLLVELKKADKKKGLADAKRLAKLEEADAKRKGKDEEKEAKKRAKFEEEEARRVAKEADEQMKKRKRAELAEERERSRQLEDTLEGQREKYASLAEKRGFKRRMEVEAPLSDALTADFWCDSWYRGRVLLFGREEALVAFEAAEGLPATAPAHAAEALRERAAQREEAGELAEEDDDAIAALFGADVCAGWAMRAWVPLTEVRPLAPPRPDDFTSASIDGTSTLEVEHRGGWYRVRLVWIKEGLRPDSAANTAVNAEGFVSVLGGKNIGVGHRVYVCNREDAQLDQEGVVAEIKPGGWYLVDFEQGGKPRNFRESDLEHVDDGAGTDSPIEDAGVAEARASALASADYHVRFASARSTDERALLPASLAQLRPGWSWKAGKWEGGPVSRVKSKRMLEREAHFERLKERWPVGMRVEVVQQDEQLEGAWYEGEIIGHEFDAKAVVRYLELHEDEGEDAKEVERKSVPKALRERDEKPRREKRQRAAGGDGGKVAVEMTEPIKYVRPVPSAHDEEARAAWVGSLVPGSAADFRYNGGWWEVELVRIEKRKRKSVSFVGEGKEAEAAAAAAAAAATAAASDAPAAAPSVTWLIKLVDFDIEHEADIELLRPPHEWTMQKDLLDGEWSEREAPEGLFLDGTLRSVLEEQANAKKGKKKGNEIQPEGAPREKPNSYEVGTKRKGVDGKTWEVVHMGSRDGNAAGLVEMWRPVVKAEPKWLQEERAKARAKAQAQVKGGFAAHELEDDEDDADEDDDERMGAVEMGPVMENEFRLAGVSAKKGYEELVYEAAVAIMGESVVARHTPAVQVEVKPEQRLWCEAVCPGCARTITLLVVPGLDVVQCCYCSHLSFSHPLGLEAAAGLAANDSRNGDLQQHSSGPDAGALGGPAAAEGGGGSASGGGASGAATPRLGIPPPPLLQLGDSAGGKGMIFGWEEDRAALALAAPPSLTLDAAADDGVGMVFGWQDQQAEHEPRGIEHELAAAAAGEDAEWDQMDMDVEEEVGGGPGAPPPSIPPSPAHADDDADDDADDADDDADDDLEALDDLEDDCLPMGGLGAAIRPPDGPPPPSLPPSPARSDGSEMGTPAAKSERSGGGGSVGGATPGDGADDEEDEAAAAAADAEAASNAAEVRKVGGYPCLWNSSGLRGVYLREDLKSKGDPKHWSAVLPEKVSRGRSGSADVFKQVPLGFFATALEAASAFAAAADAAKQQGDFDDKMLRRDPITPLLEAALVPAGPSETAAAAVDMNLVFKEADREDREDGRREAVDLIRSERSESGYKGVHRTSGQRWQTQVYYDGSLYHVGHHDDPESCARTMAVCTRLIKGLRRRGLLSASTQAKAQGKKKSKELAGLDGGAAVASQAWLLNKSFDGDDAALQVHANPKAETGLQGIFHHPQIAHYGVVAPGKAFLGYHKDAKQGALVFSRYVATIAKSLGKKYATRPWPRAERDGADGDKVAHDDRRVHSISLTSCALDSTRADYEQRMDSCVEVAEYLYELVGKVEDLAKSEDKGEKDKAKEAAEAAGTTALVPASSMDVGEVSVPVAKLESIADLSQASVPTATSEIKLALDAKGGKDVKPIKEKKAPKIVIAEYCDPNLALKVGSVVEVRQKDGTGYDGAWYTATIMAVLQKGAVRVQYEDSSHAAEGTEASAAASASGASQVATTKRQQAAAAAASSSMDVEQEGGGGGAEVEDVPISRIRPVPPVLTGLNGAPAALVPEHANTLGNTELGDTVEMFYLGGWWQVTMIHNPVLQEKPPAAVVALTTGEGGEAEGAADGAKRKSLSKEERYDRPTPPYELLVRAKFTVRALKFLNEHTDVPASRLRPLWVWKRKGGNKLTKSGKRKSSVGGGDDGGEEGAEEGADAGAEGKEVADELKEGDTIEGMWGRSRGREGKALAKGGAGNAALPTMRMGEAPVSQKQQLKEMQQMAMLAQQQALAASGDGAVHLGAGGFREALSDGLLVEARNNEGEWEGEP